MAPTSTLDALPLPPGVTEAYIDCSSSCGLNWHILRAGDAHQPLVLFCHGYPELAFSWRKILPTVAAAGYHCIAMDQRGYGRTTTTTTITPTTATTTTTTATTATAATTTTAATATDGSAAQPHDDKGDLAQYTLTNLVRDLVCLVDKLGYTTVTCIVGHDFGAVSSATAALIRPDMFQSTIQLSHPHHPPPHPQQQGGGDMQASLAQLTPPRKHYKWYNSDPAAAHDWNSPPQGLTTFLRGYFHLKSADWAGNAPHPLREWSAEELATMPEYYVMRREDTMPASVERNMAGEDFARTEAWLSAAELGVYVGEWARTGFGEALKWYRAQTASTAEAKKDMLLYAGARIRVPCAFISGKLDWGNFQQPGALESYEDAKVVETGCFRGSTLIDHAGHWVQQEQPEKVADAVVAFLQQL